MKDLEIIALIEQKKFSAALDALYLHFPMCKSFICSNGGNAEDAKDIFQEALLVLCKKVGEGNFQLTSKLSTYLFSICKFKWKDQLVKKNREVSFEMNGSEQQDVSDLTSIIEKEKKFEALDSVIQNIGKKCWDILKSYYHLGMDMTAIAEKFGYGSPKSARNQKYKCMERAKAEAKANFAHLLNA